MSALRLQTLTKPLPPLCKLSEIEQEWRELNRISNVLLPALKLQRLEKRGLAQFAFLGMTLAVAPTTTKENGFFRREGSGCWMDKYFDIHFHWDNLPTTRQMVRKVVFHSNLLISSPVFLILLLVMCLFGM